jgi:hypothetical protein
LSGRWRNGAPRTAVNIQTLGAAGINGQRGGHQALQPATRLPHMKHMTIDALEKRLVEALKSVDAHGDVAPAHVHDPMTMLLRENVVRENLVRWDDVRGRYVLTGTGRRRIGQGSRAPGAVVSFRNRSVVGSGVLHGKSSNSSLKE